MSTVYKWSGGVTPSGAVVNAKVTGTTSARLAVSTSESMTSPVYYGPAVPAAGGMVTITATGLDPSTQYHYAIEDDGAIDTAKVGAFRTFGPEGEPESFTGVVSGCAGTSSSPHLHSPGVSNSPIFDTIRGLDPDLFIHLGDRNYGNITANDPAAFRDVYDRVMAAPRQEQLYRLVPTVYVWDDHDFANNDSDGSEASRPAVSQVYRERVPSYPLPAGVGDNPIYHSFTRGRVLFIVSDTRWARVPGATMLGAAQKAWMESVLSASSAEALVWCNPTPWMGGSADTWAGFVSERNEMIDLFDGYGWLDRMVCLNADYHGLGMDTGGGNLELTGAPFPVWLWCSLDSPASGTGSNQYDMGPTSPGADRYGILEVADDGDVLHITGTGYINTTPWNSHTLHVLTATSTTPVPPRTLSLAYDDVLSRVRVTSAEVEGAGYNAFTDTFTRTEAIGWGVADTGQAWTTSGGAAANFSVSSDRGRVGLTPVATRHYTLTDAAYSDVEYTASVIVPATATGGNIAGAFLVRAQDTANYYMAQILFTTTGALQLDLYKAVGGSHTTVVSGVTLSDTYSGAARVNVRIKAQGSTLSVKAWNNLSPEPGSYQLIGSDTDYAAGQLGTSAILFTGNTNTLPVLVSFDDFATVTPPPVTLDVERSLDEITWLPVRGGQDREVPAGGSLTVDDYEFAADVANYYRVSVTDSTGAAAGSASGVITPMLSAVWVKSISRPFLNRKVWVNDFGDIEREARNGVFAVKGRSLPVSVTDVRGSRQCELLLVTDTDGEADELDLILSSGDPVFIHAPAECPVPVPSMYAVVGTLSVNRPGRLSPVRVWTLPLTEVAPPGPGVVGATITWQGVINAYATWQDVLDDQPTWNSLLELIGSPSDVVVT